VGKRGVKTAVETAVMIRGRAHRKTMKRPRSILCPSSKENKENTGQAMAINDARSLGGEQGAPAVKETVMETSVTRQWQKHCNLTACNLPGRLRGRGERA
jgi:hypothetical protein